MLKLTPNLILEKNLLSSTHPWLILLDITLDELTTIYLVRNTENINFGGQEYVAFPFEIDATKQESQGQIPTVTLRVSNVTRAIQSYLEDYEGLVGKTVTMRVVNNNLLSENYTDLTFMFEILNCSSNSQWVTFTLGAPNPLVRRFPLHRYMGNHCRYQGRFKIGAECGYTGDDKTCEGTLAACQAKGNSVRFGGFPGLTAGGLRLVG